MADLERTISIIFLGVDKIGDGISSAAGQFNKLDAAVTAVADPLARVADGVLKADAALAALAVGGIVYSVSKAIEFDTAMVHLAKVVGDDVPGALDKAKQNAISLSETYGTSVNKLIESTADFSEAGFSVEEAMGLVKNSLDLVVAGDMEAAEASNILTAALKGFQAPASEAARLVDVMNEVGNKYATNVKELSTGMASLSPIAKTMGMSFEQTAGVLTPVIEVFRSGEESANALKTGLLKLVDDSKPVKDALASLGVSQLDLNGKMKSGYTILGEVQNAFLKLDENQKLVVTSQIVGIEQAAKMQIVFDGLGKTTEVTNVALGATGSAAKEVALKLASAQADIDRFKTAFENLAIVVGDKFLAASRGVVVGATDMEKALRDSVKGGAFDPIINALAQMGVEVGQVFKGMAEAFPDAMKLIDWKPLLDAINGLKSSLGDLWGDLDLTKPADLANVIQFVINTISSLITTTSGMVQAFKPMVDSIIEATRQYNASGAEAQTMGGQILGMAKMVTEAGLAITAAVMVIAQTGADLKGVFEILQGTVTVAWNIIQASIETAALAILMVVRQMVSGLNDVTFGSFEGTLARVDGAIKNVQTSLERDYSQAVGGVNLVVKGFGDLGGGAEEAAKKVRETNAALGTIPAVTPAKIELTYEEALAAVQKVTVGLSGVPAKKEVAITGVADEASFSTAKRTIDNYITTEKGVTVITVTDNARLADTKKTIDENIPAEKKLSIQASVDIERIKAQAAEIGSYFDFKAKVDVAQIEAAAKVTVAAFDSINTTLTVTGKSLDSLFGLWAKADTFDKSSISGWIDQQLALQKSAVENQSKLIEAQVKYLDARNNALNAGQALIEIKGDGLAPQLEAFMWAVLEAIQVRVAEEHAEFLLGIA